MERGVFKELHLIQKRSPKRELRPRNVTYRAGALVGGKILNGG